jgi:hypothetical protein
MITKNDSRHHQSTSELAIEPLDRCVGDFEPHRGVVGRLHGVMLMV